ncbi:MAG: 16S rRNA (cytidine(1402)-2'-O)-methyltransferase [Candidatus Omnitrophota bacterium]
MQEKYGTLFIVATPIGNLKDITLRALDTLKAVHLIACEDTRHTKILLNHYGIKTPLTSYFEYNKITKGDYLIKVLQEGKNIALVSDAGTPGISDPGSHIIRLALKNAVPLCVIPGPAACIGGLILSGKPTDKFIFEGFLPSKQTARKNRLKQLTGEKRTIIFYESPHRLLKTLADIYEVFGDVELALIRELTKLFEEQRRECVSSLLAHFVKTKPRGEFILIL